MNILLVTPLYAGGFDAGHFWLKALNELGHLVAVWDYRTQPIPPPVKVDFTLVMKGESIEPRTLRRPRICYWPDALERTPGIEQVLQHYDRVYTPVRPTPAGMTWLPTGWDPSIHRVMQAPRDIPSLYIGTNNSPRKRGFLAVVKPTFLAGNGWPDTWQALGPQYLHDFVALASRAKVAINIHQGPVGLNRKLFELIPSAFTITDRVPGVEEVLGEDLGYQVSFDTPEEGKSLLEWALLHPEKMEELWAKEKAKIAPYTYLNACRKILGS